MAPTSTVFSLRATHDTQQLLCGTRASSVKTASPVTRLRKYRPAEEIFLSFFDSSCTACALGEETVAS